MSEERADVREVYGVDWVKTAGGALAAVVAAVLLSTLGAAGTLVGAAVGSIAATVGTALFSQGLERSRRAASDVQSTALTKVSLAQTEVLRAVRRDDEGDHEAATAHLEHAEEKLAEARAGLEGDPEDGEPTAVIGASAGADEDGAEDEDTTDEATSDSLLARMRDLGWKRLSLAAGATFVLVMIVITGFELVAGESVSQLTGGTSGDSGTSFSNLGGGSDDDGDAPTQGPTDQQTAPTDDASDEPTDTSTDETDEPTDDASDDQPSDDPSDETTAPSPSTPTSSATR